MATNKMRPNHGHTETREKAPRDANRAALKSSTGAAVAQPVAETGNLDKGSAKMSRRELSKSAAVPTGVIAAAALLAQADETDEEIEAWISLMDEAGYEVGLGMTTWYVGPDFKSLPKPKRIFHVGIVGRRGSKECPPVLIRWMLVREKAIMAYLHRKRGH